MAKPRPTRRSDLEVHLGASGLVVGRLHLGSGRRSAFSYDEGWLRDARATSSGLAPSKHLRTRNN